MIFTSNRKRRRGGGGVEGETRWRVEKLKIRRARYLLRARLVAKVVED